MGVTASSSKGDPLGLASLAMVLPLGQPEGSVPLPQTAKGKREPGAHRTTSLTPPSSRGPSLELSQWMEEHSGPLKEGGAGELPWEDLVGGLWYQPGQPQLDRKKL